MKPTLFYLIGTDNYKMFVIGLFFLFLGIFVSLLINAVTRDPHSPRSPITFSYRYLFSDNAKRLFLSVLLSLIMYRFSGNLFNMEDNMYVAFLIGFGFDKSVQMFNSKMKLF